MSDYNWKDCADPANAARLRELLEAGREVLMTWHRVGRPMREYFGVNPKDAELIASLLRETNLDVFSFLDPDELAQMRARIAELEAEVKCGRYC